MKTIPFSIEAASKPGARVVTRDGRKVLWWHYQPEIDGPLQIVAYIENDVAVRPFYTNGTWSEGHQNDKDLFLAVEPKLRPWKDRSEVPLNAWFRSKSSEIAPWYRALWIAEEGVRLASSDFTFTGLLDHWVYSIDGKTWLPCGVEE